MTACAFPLGIAHAQTKFPDKPVTLIVAHTAGGSADQRARQIAALLASRWRVSVVVENKAGGNGDIGTQAVARAKPDGYVIGMGNLAPLAVNPFLAPTAGKRFAPLQELTMISLVERGPLMLVVNPDSNYQSLTDIINAGKTKPGGLSYGSSGVGSAHHLCGELLRSLTKTNMVNIPYKGGASAIVDLLGGRLDFMFEPMYSAVPSAKAGKLRALAITSSQRSPTMPNVPTMAEAGLPGFGHVENWQGIIGPAGLSADVINELNTAVATALLDPGIREIMTAQGNEPVGGKPEVFKELVSSESRRWKALLENSKIMVE